MVNDSEFMADDFDFEALRKRVDSNWQKLGLDDESSRRSRAASLPAEKMKDMLYKAVALNAREKMLLNRGGVFIKPMLKRNEERMLALINDGLDLNKDLDVDGVKINLLHQALRRRDLDKVGLLLAAGARPKISDNAKEDTFAIIAYVKDKEIKQKMMRVVLAYMDEPLTEHWIIEYLHRTDDITDYVVGEMMARRSVELAVGKNNSNNDDKYNRIYTALMDRSMKSYEKKIVELFGQKDSAMVK